MKLRNKKTGEILRLNEDWEDYEDRLEYYYICHDGEVIRMSELISSDLRKNNIEIGNYFDTREEAEKAVEKLKAWKRLKDKGFRFTGFTYKDRGRMNELEIYCQLGEPPDDIEDMEDVRLLFGGEE